MLGAGQESIWLIWYLFQNIVLIPEYSQKKIAANAVSQIFSQKNTCKNKTLIDRDPKGLIKFLLAKRSRSNRRRSRRM